MSDLVGIPPDPDHFALLQCGYIDDEKKRCEKKAADVPLIVVGY